MKVAFLLYEHLTVLDLVGPYEVLSRVPNVEACCVGLSVGPIVSGSGLILHVTHALADVSTADILVVPGAGNATALRDCPEILDWVGHMHETTQWTTSVCTGSLILGASGVLEGVKATTHWAAFDRLSAYGACPTKERVVCDGKVVTAAGVSAGIDMALLLTEKIAGREFAQAMELVLEYDPKPPFGTGSPEKAGEVLADRVRERMIAKFERR